MTDFTTPRTWTTNELVTKAIMDLHIRDNFNAIWVGTTAGDLDYYVNSTRKSRLAKVAGGILYGGASAPAYTPGGAAGSILYNSAANTPAWLAAGASQTILYNSGDGNPTWIPITAVPGLLNAKATVNYDAGSQTVIGTTYTDITNATVNITTTRQCTIVMHSAGTLWSSDGVAYLKAVISGTAEAGGYHMNYDTVPTSIGWAYYLTGVAAGTITCKLQGTSDAAGHHATFGVGNIVVLAYTE